MQQTIELSLGERLRIFRQRAGLNQEAAAAAAQMLLPLSLSISRELVRRLEVGMIAAEKANPVHLAALARVYGVDVSDISVRAAEELESVRDLAIRSTGCMAAAA